MRKMEKYRRINIPSATNNQNMRTEESADAVLIRNNVNLFSENDVVKLIESIEEENLQIMNKYYRLNTTVETIRQRTFKDLVKKFLFRKRELSNKTHPF